MSDEVFRTCTVHARLGSISQIVAIVEGKVPLLLYVFRSERASRVYSVGGVITKVMP
ncbi:MAG: hypothetical protein ABWZ08_07150 [Pseudoxanthomonas sp.]